MTLSAEYFYTIKGIITFADGTKCFVAPEKGLRDLFSGTIVNGSTTIVLKPDKNCNACNNLNK